MSNNTNNFNPFAHAENFGCNWGCYKEIAHNNWKAVTNAGHMWVEGMQSIARRQAEAVQRHAQRQQDCCREHMNNKSMEDMQNKHANYLVQSLHDYCQDARDIFGIYTKTVNETLDILNDRVKEMNAELCNAATVQQQKSNKK